MILELSAWLTMNFWSLLLSVDSCDCFLKCCNCV
jgi:hypothetical protein